MMPSKASHKSKGGDKDAASKNTINPRGSGGGKQVGDQTGEPFEQDAKRRMGQFGGAGEPPLMKK
jgi:hypothetical protein